MDQARETRRRVAHVLLDAMTAVEWGEARDDESRRAELATALASLEEVVGVSSGPEAARLEPILVAALSMLSLMCQSTASSKQVGYLDVVAAMRAPVDHLFRTA